MRKSSCVMIMLLLGVSVTAAFGSEVEPLGTNNQTFLISPVEGVKQGGKNEKRKHK
jgi:hypothetical protein